MFLVEWSKMEILQDRKNKRSTIHEYYNYNYQYCWCMRRNVADDKEETQEKDEEDKKVE